MANKKINQLVSKTSILSTDLFGIGDATTGQLFKKTIAELQAAIGGAVISVNGLVGTVVLDTDDIQELATPTNKYFTDARARGAISLTVTGNSGASTYSSGTGVLNVPTYTLAGLGGITASFLSGTSGISYNSTTGVISYSGTVYTDSSIRALLSGGTGITYNSSTGAISYSGTVYTDSSVRALISLTTTGTSGASTYNNTTGVINVPEYTLAGLGGISLTSLSGGTGITYNSSTGAISYSGTVYTDASVRALISASGAVSYNNTTGVISLTSGNLTEATSSVLTITGGTGAVLGSGTSIQVKQASSTVSGFLSSTDWSTFNAKATISSGTTNYHAKFTSSTTIGNSIVSESSTTVTVGGTLISGGSSKFVKIGNEAGIFTNSTYFTDLVSLDATVLLSRSDGLYTGAIFTYESATSDNVGIVSNGAIKMVVNGTANRGMIITSDGNVGIGTSTPNTLLTTNQTGTSGYFYSGQQSGTEIAYWYYNASEVQFSSKASARALVFLTSDVERMRIASGGAATFSNNITIGNSLTYGYIYGPSSQRLASVGGNGTFFFTGTSGLYFNDAADTVNLGRITNAGNFLFGTTTDNGERLYVSGAIRATGTITANSDITLKKNLLKIENALEKVEQINGYTYEFKEDDSKRHAGVIAQEIETVLPEIVNKGNDGILGVEYGNISALLIEAIKEQQTQINELKALLNK